MTSIFPPSRAADSRKVETDVSTRLSWALGRLPALAVTVVFATPSFGRDLTFIGNSTVVQSYGVHCPPGKKDGVEPSGRFIFDQTGSFTDWRSFAPPQIINDDIKLTIEQDPAGKDDNVTIGGFPAGYLNPVDGPAATSSNGCPIKGSSGGYTGDGFNVTNVSGAVANLTVRGHGTLSLGDINVGRTTTLAAAGNFPLLHYTFVEGQPSIDFPTTFAATTITATGGSLKSFFLELSAGTTDPAYPGTVVLSGGHVEANVVNVRPPQVSGTQPSYIGDVIVKDEGVLVGTQVDIVTGASTIKGATRLTLDNGRLLAGTLSIGDNPDGVGRSAANGAVLAITNQGVAYVNTLQVGSFAPGFLTIDKGGILSTSGVSFIALTDNASGSFATLSGAGTKWSSTGQINVGGAGRGSLLVTAGASLESSDIVFVGSSVGGVGSVTVDDKGTVVSDDPQGAKTSGLTLGSVGKSTGLMTIEGAGSSWTSKQSAVIGGGGEGHMLVTDGGLLDVRGDILRVARDAGSIGSLVVTGRGSKVQAAGELFVGFGGKGDVEINSSGGLTAASVEIGSQAGGRGAVVVSNGGTLDIKGRSGGGASLTIGAAQGSSGRLTLSGPSSTLTAQGGIVVGDAGDGKLSVDRGAALDLTQTQLTIGKSSGGTGEVVIDSSSATNKVQLGTVVVGNAGNGVLHVIGDGGGAGVSFDGSRILLGSRVGSSGIFWLEKAKLDLGADIEGGAFVVGDKGAGLFRIGTGAEVSSRALTVGTGSTGEHAVEVRGAGAKLTVDGDISLAKAPAATGRLVIRDGGVARAANLMTSTNPATPGGAFAQIIIQGKNDAGASTLAVRDKFYLSTSTYDVEIRNGAQLTAKRIGLFGDASSTFVIDGRGSAATYESSLSLFGATTVSNGARLAWTGRKDQFVAPAAYLGIDARLDVTSGGRLEAPDLEIRPFAAMSVTGDDSSAKARDIMLGGRLSLDNRAAFEANKVVVDKDGVFEATGDSTAKITSLEIAGKVTTNGISTTLTLGGGDAAALIGSSGGLLDIAGNVTVAGAASITGGADPFQIKVHNGGTLNFTAEGATTFDGARLSVENAHLAFTGANAGLALNNQSSLNVSGFNSSVLGLDTLTVSSNSSATFTNKAIVQVSRHLAVNGVVDVDKGVLAVGASFEPLFGVDSLYGDRTPIPDANSPTGFVFRRHDGYVLIGLGGLVHGTSKIIGDVINVGGIGHAGNSPGTLTIDGNYIQSGAGALLLSIGPNDYSKLIVTGAAVFNGGSIVLESFQGARPTLGTRYSFIQATGGVTGQVDSIVSPFQGVVLSPTFGADGLTAQLLHAPNYFLCSAITRNQQSVARALDALAQGAPTGAAALLANALTYASQDQIARSFDQLSGEAYASVKGVLIDDSRYARAAALDRLRGAFGGVAAPNMPLLARSPEKTAALATETLPVDLEKLVFWGQGFDAHGSSNGSRAGAAGVSHSATGFFLGFDAPAFHNWRIGAYGGYDHANLSVSARSSSGKSDAFHAGLYAGGQWGPFGLRLGASYSGHDIDIRRSLSFASLSDQPWRRYGAGLFQLFGEAAYGVDAGFLALEPFAGLALTRLHTNGFREFGGVAALATRGDDTDVAFTTLGVRFSKSLPLFEAPLAIGGSAAWRHAMGAVTPLSFASLAGGGDFSVAGAPIDRDAFLVEPGVDLAVTPNASFGVHYVGQFGNHANSRAVKGAMTVKF